MKLRCPSDLSCLPRATLPLAFSLAAFPAVAASIDSANYAQLVNQAGSKGVVRVMVSLDDSVSLSAIKGTGDAIRAAMEQKARVLLAELGQNKLDSGYWNNGMGQMGVYVNADGLNILKSTAYAKSFLPDTTSKMRYIAVDSDGSLDAVEDAIIQLGHADVEVYLNTDAVDYDIDADGKTSYRPGANFYSDIAMRTSRIRGKGFARGLQNIDSSPAQNGRPGFRARIDLTAFYGLIEDTDVRAVRLAGHRDNRAAKWAPKARSVAATSGAAEVIVALRGSEIYSPKSGYMSSKSWEIQESANLRAFREILGKAGISEKSDPVKIHSGIGVASMKLTRAQLDKLFSAADPRILSVDFSEGGIHTMLPNSTKLINAPSAWNAGYEAAGQYIVIIDSGVKKDHLMFQMNGATKVTYEGCFGTNLAPFRSICDNPGSLSDSPLWQLNSGRPYNNSVVCAQANCGHGTHVAGIAAGKKNAGLYNGIFQGVAPSANIVAFQVFSYDDANKKQTAYDADLLAALTAVKDATTFTPAYSPLVTVNMSLGRNAYPGNCSANTGVESAIADLISKHIPVVVATGNDSIKNGIAWPACVPNTIKVSAVDNSPTTAGGTAIASYANIANPNNYTGQMLLAPGGSVATAYVFSAGIDPALPVIGMVGTSQAAPHVSGLYAAIKAAVPGITLADATGWIVNTSSIPVTDPGTGISYRRIKIPNFN